LAILIALLLLALIIFCCYQVLLSSLFIFTSQYPNLFLSSADFSKGRALHVKRPNSDRRLMKWNMREGREDHPQQGEGMAPDIMPTTRPDTRSPKCKGKKSRKLRNGNESYVLGFSGIPRRDTAHACDFAGLLERER
jgi:hypothetical protein